MGHAQVTVDEIDVGDTQSEQLTLAQARVHGRREQRAPTLRHPGDEARHFFVVEDVHFVARDRNGVDGDGRVLPDEQLPGRRLVEHRAQRSAEVLDGLRCEAGLQLAREEALDEDGHHLLA